jgi:hypothetical protein
MHGASRGAWEVVCPRGVCAVGAGVVVAGKEIGLTGGAHGSARGTHGRTGWRRQDGPPGQREKGGSERVRAIGLVPTGRARRAERGRRHVRGSCWARWAERSGEGWQG